MQAQRPTPGPRRWQLSIDTGGTFTDGWAVAPDGVEHWVKVLSSSAVRTTADRVDGPRIGILPAKLRADGHPGNLAGLSVRVVGSDRPPAGILAWDPAGCSLDLTTADHGITAGQRIELVSPEPAPLFAARLLTGVALDALLPAMELRLQTTLGTNALLERRGAEVVLFITRGFADVLRIGTQQRPDLFALDVARPNPLTHAVVEVDERLDADGAVVRPLDVGSLSAAIAALDRRPQIAAVVLVHAWRNPVHEQLLAEHLEQLGIATIIASHAVAPSIQLLRRTETTVIEAYLTPLVATFLASIEARLTTSSRLLVMSSAGGLVPAAGFRPKDGLLSGPAAGVAGASRAAGLAGHRRVLSFDMGGTSTDVARFDGAHDYVFEQRIGDAQLAAPALQIETVAAGGGSICGFDGHRLTVGPGSAGALPGPACFGDGGPLTLTDVNLLLGRLQPERFGVPVDMPAARNALAALAEAVAASTGQRPTEPDLLRSLVDIADEHMANAIRRVSVRRGYDPREYALLAFGGAAGQHAVGIAERLDIGTVIVPPGSALLSAQGGLSAVVERFAERQILAPLDALEVELPAIVGALEAQAIAEVRAASDTSGVEIRRRIVRLRAIGQEDALSIDYSAGQPLTGRFAQKYAERYGDPPPDRPLEVESVRVVAAAQPEPGSDRMQATAPPASEPAAAEGPIRDGIVERAALGPGQTVLGPVLVVEDHTTSCVPHGWQATTHPSGALVLTGLARPQLPEPTLAAARLELFSSRFGTIAAEMGELLGRTAISTNIRERRDFSCAILDSKGDLIVNAPHIPVHLGSLGLCVRELRSRMVLGPGDVVVTNHPAYGGSHLPDVTVVSPIHGKSGRLLGFVANRAHHAELGGVTPGSMPPHATRLAEEGVVIPPTYLVQGKRERWSAIERLLRSGDHPTRALSDNLADLRAAVAANRYGVTAVQELVERHGEETVAEQMERLKLYAQACVEAAFERLGSGRFAAVEELDSGAHLAVAIEVDGRCAKVSFRGTAPMCEGNLNATPAVVRSVVLYVLRLLVREPLPLNEGLLAAVEIDLPPGLLNPHFPADPRQAPAIVGGNVETSQRLVDALLKALGLVAASQGTMNNLVFGNSHFGYYETIAGGSGAGDGFSGADAVQSHMTNTRITDVEILERRYPVRVERFAIRSGSGGRGHHRGGDGVVRELRFLAPLQLSILSQRRNSGPFGLAGGHPGAPGEQYLIRADGSIEELQGIDGAEVHAGDRFVIETPGGGGYGPPPGD